jgi:6-pyruvoyltetrahydropterin/6-carboxytetrahydropterin synthase
MITCTRRIQFCAGHRVMGHENKCAHLHGHNYVVLVTAQGTEGLDRIGRVVDFAVLKHRLGGWIEDKWDHGLILNTDDVDVWEAVRVFVASGVDQKTYAMPDNPTAENMANHLLRVIGPQVLDDTGVTLTTVRVWETENCYADATL